VEGEALPSVPESLDRDPSEGSATPALDPLAIARLRRLGGDVLAGRMASLFLELARQRLSEARSGLAAGDHDAVRRAAHSLMSSAGNMGANSVLEASGRLEDGAERGLPVEELNPIFAAVEHAFESARPELAALVTTEES
jgi:HPt (histidine-containing phosphotransfer) domain-containing protein